MLRNFLRLSHSTRVLQASRLILLRSSSTSPIITAVHIPVSIPPVEQHKRLYVLSEALSGAEATAMYQQVCESNMVDADFFGVFAEYLGELTRAQEEPAAISQLHPVQRDQQRRLHEANFNMLKAVTAPFYDFAHVVNMADKVLGALVGRGKVEQAAQLHRLMDGLNMEVSRYCNEGVSKLLVREDKALSELEVAMPKAATKAPAPTKSVKKKNNNNAQIVAPTSAQGETCDTVRVLPPVESTLPPVVKAPEATKPMARATPPQVSVPPVTTETHVTLNVAEPEQRSIAMPTVLPITAVVDPPAVVPTATPVATEIEIPSTPAVCQEPPLSTTPVAAVAVSLVTPVTVSELPVAVTIEPPATLQATTTFETEVESPSEPHASPEPPEISAPVQVQAPEPPVTTEHKQESQTTAAPSSVETLPVVKKTSTPSLPVVSDAERKAENLRRNLEGSHAVKVLTSTNQLEHAMSTFNRLQKQGVHIDPLVLAGLLEALQKEKNGGNSVAMAEKLWACRAGNGVGVHPASYYAMMSVCAKNKQVDRAFQLAAESPSATPNELMGTKYLALWRAVRTAPHHLPEYRHAVPRLLAMLSTERILNPAAVVYEPLLHELAEQGDCVSAEYFYWEMQRKGLTPSETAQANLMRCYAAALSIGEVDGVRARVDPEFYDPQRRSKADNNAISVASAKATEKNVYKKLDKAVEAGRGNPEAFEAWSAYCREQLLRADQSEFSHIFDGGNERGRRVARHLQDAADTIGTDVVKTILQSGDKKLVDDMAAYGTPPEINLTPAERKVAIVRRAQLFLAHVTTSEKPPSDRLLINYVQAMAWSGDEQGAEKGMALFAKSNFRARDEVSLAIVNMYLRQKPHARVAKALSIINMNPRCLPAYDAVIAHTAGSTEPNMKEMRDKLIVQREEWSKRFVQNRRNIDARVGKTYTAATAATTVASTSAESTPDETEDALSSVEATISN